jgi:hypothetical protein
MSETRRKEQVEQAVAWREAAVADGWAIEPTYPGSEGTDRAAKLKRDGWVAMILTRTPVEGDRWRDHYEGAVHVWGPDRMAVVPGAAYSWDRLRAGLRHCAYCNADDVDTQCVGFAGRTCSKCLPEQRRQQEFPGWTN